MKVFGKGLVSIGCVVFLVFGATASEPKEKSAEENAKATGSATKEVQLFGIPVGPERVELTVREGFTLIGESYSLDRKTEGKPPGVLLLHQMRGKRQDWRQLAGELVKRGYAVLAMDLRGHGESTKGKDGRTWNYRTMEKSEFPAMVDDALVALDYMKRELADPDRLGIIGASIGANAALNAAAKDGSVKTVVLLSPGIEYHLIKTEPATRQYEGAVFLAASEEDRYSAETIRKLHELAPGKCEMKMYSGAGHGTNMFAPTKGDLQERILSWVDETLKGD